MAKRIAVVGASLAGARVIKALRRRGWEGEIVLVGEESDLPYDRPPLSKQFLTNPDLPAPRWLEPESFYEDVELRLGVRATALSTRERSVTLDDGSIIRADHLIIATGAGARSLPELPDADRVLRLRTLADARRIHAALGSAVHVAVIGGGFIGCEVAASARARGLRVSVVEPAPAPVLRSVGELVGSNLASLHRQHGVDMHLDAAVTDVRPSAGRSTISLTDGTQFDADLIVVGVGADPRTEWLDGSGLQTGGGVHCDESGKAVNGGGHIWALGDVAAWSIPRLAQRRRLEHWTSAVEQATVLAANLVAGDAVRAHDPVPYVWSDQYDHKLQILGDVGSAHEITLLDGTLEAHRFVMGYSHDGRLTGVVACDMPRPIAMLRPAVAEQRSLHEVVDGVAP